MNVDHAERFEELRATLVRHAYRMLGQYGDAEDVVQDAYLRWTDALGRTTIDDNQAYLRTTVTRLCLDRLRSARAKREIYIGPWLPEPVISDVKDDPQAAATVADDISFALMLTLERLAPLERASFLLHDVLDVPFTEVAQTLGRSELAVRKLASRARDHVRDEGRQSRADRAEMERVRDRLVQALQNDDPAMLKELLTEDVVFTSDGGGKADAATVPVAGSENVTKLLRGVMKKGAPQIARMEFVTLNGLPGMVTFGFAGEVRDTIALQIVGGRIAALYVTRNPDKLRTVSEQLMNLSSS